MLKGLKRYEARPSELRSKIKTTWGKLVRSQASPSLAKIVCDARLFVLNNGPIIEEAPLQIYCSALIFSPTKSITRDCFWNQVPRWIIQSPNVARDWNPYLQTLKGDSDKVYAVVFSPNGRLIASGSSHNSVRLWDALTGTERSALKGHSGSVVARSLLAGWPDHSGIK